jgi:PglZ domain
MTAPTANESALREHLAAWISGSRRHNRTILVRAQPTWTGPDVLTIRDARVRIVEGVSGLAALDAMRSAGSGELIAVLTDLTEAQLGTAVVLEAHTQHITDLDEWSIVPTLFGARDASVPRLVRDLGPWVPRVLVSLRRDRPYPPAPGGVLSAEHVVRSLLISVLNLDRVEDLELSTALTPLDDPGVRTRFQALDVESREGLVRAAAARVDQHLGMALRAATTPGNVSVVAVGLVVGELWAGGVVPPDAATAAARVRVERYIGTAPSAAASQRYGAAARLIAQRWLAQGDRHARDVFDQAEAICGDLGWAEGASASDFLPAGLRARVTRFAATIEAATATPDARASNDVDAALAAIETHGARATFDRSFPTAGMASRLVRWLASRPGASHSVIDALSAYATDGAWAERALGDLWDGDADRGLADAYQVLAHAVQAARRVQDAAATAWLTGNPPVAGDVTPVEGLLSQLVVPLSASGRVLLIVLDGMSVPTAVELVPELGPLGWTELVRDTAARHRGVALAALPTVTEYSRTSLFAGELLAGNQQVEKARFAAAVNGVLFHKDDLRSAAGHALPSPVISAIADQSRKIVAAVLNTIDDALDSADVDAVRWSLRSIAHLESLLAAAYDAGRTVILTSDHGHVVERGSELRNVPQSAARWRATSTGPAQGDELLVAGPRVLAAGGAAVLAISDGIRYASKKAGYHGGGSLAELAIPIIVLKPRGADNPAGWVEIPPQDPTWWNEPSRALVDALPVAERPPKAKAPKAADPTAPTLFDLEREVARTTPAKPGGGLAEMLVASATYIARRTIAGRHPIDDAVAAAVVSVLVAGGGRAHRDTLAAAAGIPASELAGLLAALRRVLNVDGYPVVDVDADQVTVLLDVTLLHEQFELGSG